MQPISEVANVVILGCSLNVASLYLAFSAQKKKKTSIYCLLGDLQICVYIFLLPPFPLPVARNVTYLVMVRW